MPDEWQVVKVCEGVEIAFDPAKFEAAGMPRSITVEGNKTLTFDLRVHTVIGNQDIKVENILTLDSV